jgi:hypothetical protein
MQLLDHLNGFIRQKTCAKSGTDARLTVKVVAAYEDLGSGTLVHETVERLTQELEPDGTVESSLWKFEILDSAQLRRIASDEGADADILMIATRAEFGLTDPVQAWLRTSFSSRRSPPLALVGLIHPDEPGAFVTLSVRDYLRQVAEQNGTELFVNEWEETIYGTAEELVPTRVFGNLHIPILAR